MSSTRDLSLKLSPKSRRKIKSDQKKQYEIKYEEFRQALRSFNGLKSSMDELRDADAELTKLNLYEEILSDRKEKKPITEKIEQFKVLIGYDKKTEDEIADKQQFLTESEKSEKRIKDRLLKILVDDDKEAVTDPLWLLDHMLPLLLNCYKNHTQETKFLSAFLNAAKNKMQDQDEMLKFIRDNLSALFQLLDEFKMIQKDLKKYEDLVKALQGHLAQMEDEMTKLEQTEMAIRDQLLLSEEMLALFLDGYKDDSQKDNLSVSFQLQLYSEFQMTQAGLKDYKGLIEFNQSVLAQMNGKVTELKQVKTMIRSQLPMSDDMLALLLNCYKDDNQEDYSQEEQEVIFLKVVENKMQEKMRDQNIALTSIQNGYDLCLISSEDDFDKLADNLKNKPYLIKTQDNKYSLWGHKGGNWQLTQMEENFQIPREWLNKQEAVFVSFNDEIHNILKEGHTRNQENLSIVFKLLGDLQKIQEELKDDRALLKAAQDRWAQMKEEIDKLKTVNGDTLVLMEDKVKFGMKTIEAYRQQTKVYLNQHQSLAETTKKDCGHVIPLLRKYSTLGEIDKLIVKEKNDIKKQKMAIRQTSVSRRFFDEHAHVVISRHAKHIKDHEEKIKELQLDKKILKTFLSSNKTDKFAARTDKFVASIESRKKNPHLVQHSSIQQIENDIHHPNHPPSSLPKSKRYGD